MKKKAQGSNEIINKVGSGYSITEVDNILLM
jgi:hypothetical protein